MISSSLETAADAVQPEQGGLAKIVTACAQTLNPVPLLRARQALGIKHEAHVYRIFRVDGDHRACYVGSTTGKTDRSYFHWWHLSRRSHHSPRLQAAWLKYGADQFRYEVLEKTSVELLRTCERKWMANFAEPKRALPRYNCSKEVDQPPHWTPTVATRAKWSAQRLGRRHSPETRAKIGAAARGKRHTQETVDKMRARHRGRRPTKEARQRSIQANKARFLERVRLAKSWCITRGIHPCTDGTLLTFQIARCLTTGSLRLDDRLPSVGALAKALGLSHATVSLALRRRAPVIGGLTIIAPGTGLLVAKATDNEKSRPLSFYALSTRARISQVLRERGIRPTQQCRDRRRKRHATNSDNVDVKYLDANEPSKTLVGNDA